MNQNGHKKTSKSLSPGGVAILSTATGGAALGITIGAAVGGGAGAIVGGLVGAAIGVVTGVLSRSDSEANGKPAARR